MDPVTTTQAAHAAAAGVPVVGVEYLIGTIVTLGGVIAFLARTIFKLQEERRTADLGTQKDMLQAIQNSTSATNNLSALLEDVLKKQS